MAVPSADPALLDRPGVVSAKRLDAAAAEIRSWPDYQPSPLLSLPGLARHLDLGAVLVKDEGRRFGLGGVKALGAPYGLSAMLRQRGLAPASPGCADVTAIAATDGNHGLALAWAARRFGCRARVFVGAAVDEARMAVIRACGGAVTIVQGTYDDAVLAAEQAAAADDRLLLVTDTDYGNACEVTRDIMAGYGLLGRELHDQWPEQPSHLFLQCGVGGMAAGVAAGLWHASGRPPRVVTVEPDSAACLRASLASGRLEHVPGDLRTRMVGLSCGRPSLPALTILRTVTQASLSIPDAIAAEVQGLLADGATGDPPLACGDTGVAGLAGLWAAATTPDLRARLGLGPASRVAAVVSEGPLAAPGG